MNVAEIGHVGFLSFVYFYISEEVGDSVSLCLCLGVHVDVLQY